MICRSDRLFLRLLPWIDRLTAPFLHATENSLVNAAQASEHCSTQYYIYIYICVQALSVLAMVRLCGQYFPRLLVVHVLLLNSAHNYLLYASQRIDLYVT